MFTGALALVPPHPDVLPLAPAGNIAAVQGNTGSDGDTRLYYQNSDNSITELVINTAFIRSHTTNYPGSILVPGDQVRTNTPIAAVTVNGTALQEVFHQSTLNRES